MFTNTIYMQHDLLILHKECTEDGDTKITAIEGNIHCTVNVPKTKCVIFQLTF